MKKITFWVISYIVVFLSLPARAYFIDDSSHFAFLGATSSSFSGVPLGKSDSFDIGVLFQGHGVGALRIRSNPCGLACAPETAQVVGSQAGGIRGTGFGIYFPFIISKFFGGGPSVHGPLPSNPFDEDGEETPIEDIVLGPCEDEEAADCSFDSGEIVEPVVDQLPGDGDPIIEDLPSDTGVPDDFEDVDPVTEVPEPAALVLLGLGLLGIGLSRRRNLVEKSQ